VIFKAFRLERIGQVSYLLGCARAKEAAIVDPAAELGVDFYVLEAADRGLAITHVLETHVHADFISCARELAAACGAAHCLLQGAAVRYSFTPLADGDRLDLGQVRLEVIATPGHTPEHAAYLVTDGARSDEPWFVLTGDSLFVGDVGRPDLLVGDQAVDLLDEGARARLQFASIRDRLFTLPEHVEIYPGHYGGSACGGVNLSGKVTSTIGFEKRFNRAMQQPDAESFARFVADTAKPFPQDYSRIKLHNLGIAAADGQGAVV
jgi:glyoxylase-like metal-dependent hydrolase (beta-lactamase superfamily II)